MTIGDLIVPYRPTRNPRATPPGNGHPTGRFPSGEPSDRANPLVSTFPWKYAPDGYATRRQLRDRGLRPGGQAVAAQIMRRSRRRKAGVAVAYLYRIELAKPVRPMTAAKRAALAKAMTARRTCPACRVDAGYCIPTSLGMCPACAYPEEQRAA